jgi:membrane dipeptidase
MSDVSSYPLLVETLRARGWSQADLIKLTHGNALRAMRSMEDAAQ